MTGESEILANDARLAELLASRLCHDLASPAGAVLSGLELIEEFEDETADDALRLMGDSARVVARRLAFYRLAFGFAGNSAGLTLGEARTVTADFMADGRTQLDWPANPDASAFQAQEGGIKLLLILVFVAMECLPRGGKVLVALDRAHGQRILIEASGAGARVTPAASAGLSGGEAAPLDAASAPAHYAGAVARRLKTRIQIAAGPDRIRLEAGLP